MFEAFKKITTAILDIILPLFCVSCGSYGTILCDKCYRSIPLLAKKLEKPTKNLDFILIATKYENPVIKSAIKGLKYQGLKTLAQPLGKLLYRSLEINRCLETDTVIVPVPLHKRKQKMRGYNQSILLASELGQLLHTKVDLDLKRIRYTVSQSKLTREERLKNVENVFEYKGKQTARAVLLLDDVTTTFATLDEAARAMKKRGTRRVGAIVIAKNDI